MQVKYPRKKIDNRKDNQHVFLCNIDQDEVKELEFQIKNRMVIDTSFNLRNEIIDFNFDEMVRVVKKMYETHMIVTKLNESDLDKLIKEGV